MYHDQPPTHLSYMFEVVKDNTRENSPRENGNFDFVKKEVEKVYDHLYSFDPFSDIADPEAFEKMLDRVKSMKPGDDDTFEWITVRCLYLVY